MMGRTLLWLVFASLFCCCARPEPQAPTLASAGPQAAAEERLAGLRACEQAMMAARQAPPEDRSTRVAAGCKDLFPAGSCRETLASLAAIAPDARAARVTDACLLPLCGRLGKKRPRLCRAGAGTLPASERIEAVRAFQLAWLQEQACPQLAEPRPGLCTMDEPPGSAAGHQMLLLEFQKAAGDKISPETRALIMGLGLVASLGAIRVEALGPPRTMALEQRPALRVHLLIKDEGLWLSFPEGGGRGFALPMKPEVADLAMAMASIKDSPLKPRVSISATAGVPYAAIVSLMDALITVGFEQIAIAPLAP